ncbi:36408_t:CDS:2, partial [Gigaspora margarita]
NNTNTNNEKCFWVKFAEIGQKGGFNNKKVFEGLCQVMAQIADCEQHKKGFQNLKYSDQFSDFLVILASLTQVKRLVDTIKYTGPIIVMSDNTKLKERLGFLSLYSCIVGSTFLIELTKVSLYEDIYQIIDTIKLYNAIASQVCVYLLQIEEEDCFADGHSQLTFILDSTRRSQNCNIEDYASIGITNRSLEMSVLVKQCHSHKAYTNQRMERKVTALSASGPNYRFNSSLVSFLLSNECARPGILRQNR